MEGDFIKIHHWLLPLSWLYGLGVGMRNLLFDIGVLRSRSFDIPVISVGNITVGGAGKTPYVEYLIRLLQQKAQVAVLSRGYKRKTKGYQVATKETSSAEIGDEPYQMYKKYGVGGSCLRSDSKGRMPKPIYVAVNANRCKGIENITHDEATSDTDVVLLDDAYQHRYVKPGINILLVDYHRLIIYDKLLPAGRLRESQEGKRRADLVIVTKCPKDLKPMEYRVLQKALNILPYQKLFFTTLSYGEMYRLFPEDHKDHSTLNTPHSTLNTPHLTLDTNVLLLTGIASPEQLTLDLKHLTEHLTPMAFHDHHNFSLEDAIKINDTFALLPEPRIIITTEKDSARLVDLDGLSDDVRRSLWVLPVEIEFMLEGQESFDEKIVSYVHKNSRNSSLIKNKERQEAERKAHHHESRQSRSKHAQHHNISDVNKRHEEERMPKTIKF